MLVPVGATLLVAEAQRVEQLVLDRSVVNAAAVAQRQRLAVALATHVGVASAEMLDSALSSSFLQQDTFQHGSAVTDVWNYI